MSARPTTAGLLALAMLMGACHAQPVAAPGARPERLPARLGTPARLRPRGPEGPLVASGPLIAHRPLVAGRTVVPRGALIPERPVVPEGTVVPGRAAPVVACWPVTAIGLAARAG